MKSYTKDEIAVIWLDSFKGLEQKYKLALLEKADYAAEIMENLSKFYTLITKAASVSVYNNMQGSLKGGYIDSLLSSLKAKGVICVTSVSKGYPSELKNFEAYPIIFYAKGNTALLNSGFKFGIVGSRRTLPIPLSAAEEISKNLSASGAVIVSGLAEGGDSAAIKGALASGNIISVLAYGFDYVYPEFNRQLLNKVIEKGLAVTEHAPDIAPQPYLFPVRNRIIAALSRGVLIVSGGEKSGTNHTASFALNYGKDVFAFPYTIGVNSGKGCNALLKSGGIFTDSVLDITGHYGIDFVENDKTLTLSESEQCVYQLIKSGASHLSAIVEKSKMAVSAVMPTLLSLELKGLIIKSGSNTYTEKF